MLGGIVVHSRVIVNIRVAHAEAATAMKARSLFFCIYV